jgi:choline kinase
MQAIVLAAGDGDRLHPRTADRPKSLIALRGRPIIAHVLDALHAGGIDDVTIVLGYEGAQLERAVAEHAPAGMRVRCVHNDAWAAGNARSLWAARDAVAGPFVLTMADHLIEPDIVRALARDGDGRCRLAVEHAAADDPRGEEATRAQVRDGRVLDLGKAIEPWNALDTGAFWCTPRIFESLTPATRDGEVGALFATLARAGELDAVDVTGRRWIDIDTEEDLRRAELLLGDDGRFA